MGVEKQGGGGLTRGEKYSENLSDSCFLGEREKKIVQKQGGVFRALESESQNLVKNRGGVFIRGGGFGMKGTVYIHMRLEFHICGGKLPPHRCICIDTYR